jgi:hypothetical protein
MNANMAYNLENTIANDILCYLSTSRDSQAHDDIVSIAVAYYKPEVIKQAKEIFFKICNEKLTSRRATREHPNPSVPDLKDILDLFIKQEGKNICLPSFVANSYASMPPQSGFIGIARVIGSLRDEIASLRTELSQVRENRDKDIKSLEDISDVKQDISDIKIILSVRPMPLIAPENEIKTATNNEINSASINEYNTAPIENKDNSSPPRRSYLDAFRSKPGPFAGEGRRKSYNSGSANHQEEIKSPKYFTYTSGTTGKYNRMNNSSYEPKLYDIYIGGCNVGCESMDVIRYCNSITKSDIIKCVELETRSELYKSYKVTLTVDDREKLLAFDYWPRGITVRKFYNSRARNNI